MNTPHTYESLAKDLQAIEDLIVKYKSQFDIRAKTDITAIKTALDREMKSLNKSRDYNKDVDQ
jgi:hypothetical protein